jgi:hypothetical protein
LCGLSRDHATSDIAHACRRAEKAGGSGILVRVALKAVGVPAFRYLHNYLCLHARLTTRTNGLNPGTFKIYAPSKPRRMDRTASTPYSYSFPYDFFQKDKREGQENFKECNALSDIGELVFSRVYQRTVVNNTALG